MDAGKLIHRITIQSQTEIVDPATGYRTWAWVDRVVNEPAQFLAGPGREWLAGEALRAMTAKSDRRTRSRKVAFLPTP